MTPCIGYTSIPCFGLEIDKNNNALPLRRLRVTHSPLPYSLPSSALQWGECCEDTSESKVYNGLTTVWNNTKSAVVKLILPQPSRIIFGEGDIYKKTLERKRVPCLPGGFCLKVQHFETIFHDSPLRFAQLHEARFERIVD